MYEWVLPILTSSGSSRFSKMWSSISKGKSVSFFGFASDPNALASFCVIWNGNVSVKNTFFGAFSYVCLYFCLNCNWISKKLTFKKIEFQKNRISKNRILEKLKAIKDVRKSIPINFWFYAKVSLTQTTKTTAKITTNKVFISLTSYKSFRKSNFDEEEALIYIRFICDKTSMSRFWGATIAKIICCIDNDGLILM